MKQKFLTRLWAILLSALGFGAVSCNHDEPDIPSMYGTPQGAFEYKAKVVDPTSTPLKGVQMTSVNAYQGRFYKPEFDSPLYLKTDDQGGVSGKSEIARPDSVFFYLHDPENRFVDTLCAYKVQPMELSEEGKNGSWRWGKVTKSVEIKVKTKQ